jgi:hypothetical protein
MSIEILEDSETGGQGESPIPALRNDLEDLIDSEARQRLEEYISGLSTEPPHCWLASKATQHLKNDDPIELVIDLCSEICEIAAVSGPFLFPDPDKEEIKEIKRSVGNIQRQLNGALTFLKRARKFSDYYSSSDPSPGEPDPITSSEIDKVANVIDRAWRWHEYTQALEKLDLPLPEKRTTPGRPAADHVNALEWRLWQLLQCTGMTRRVASQYPASVPESCPAPSS